VLRRARLQLEQQLQRRLRGLLVQERLVLLLGALGLLLGLVQQSLPWRLDVVQRSRVRALVHRPGMHMDGRMHWNAGHDVVRIGERKPLQVHAGLFAHRPAVNSAATTPRS
jgi:hypothetical protein